MHVLYGIAKMMSRTMMMSSCGDCRREGQGGFFVVW